MLRISAIYRSKSKHQGFTLIEVLVVLVLISLLASVVYPGLSKLVISYQRSTLLDNIVQTIENAPVTAMQSAKQLVLTDIVASKVPSSDQWQLSSDNSITVLESGFCEGGVLMLSYEEIQYTLSVSSPFCSVEVN